MRLGLTLRQVVGAVCAFTVAAGGQFLTQHHGDYSVVLVTGMVAAASYFAGVIHGRNGG